MKKEQKIVFFTIIVLCLAFVIGSNFYKSSQTNKTDNSLLIKDYSMKFGDDNAKVKLVEFFDPACGTCAQFYFLVEDLMHKHEGKIQLILRYAPFHKNSSEVVKILEAAKKQNMFKETLEALFTTQEQWINHHEVNPYAAWAIVSKLWLDVEKLKKDAQDPLIEMMIKQDLQDANTLHVNKTPSYFVNGKPLVKFGYKELVELIESEL